jgi:FAD/FMN-containing dehydrogenase
VADIGSFIEALGEIPTVTDPLAVRRKSRDMTANYSPVMRRELKDKFADVIVRPRSKQDIFKIASAAARHRVPLMARGAGTCNFGQGIPLAGGAVLDITGLDRVMWTRGSTVRAECGARLDSIDKATRPTGWELRMHSSTKKVATIGGFVGGGHAGIGSCVYGILRDRGNIRAIEVVSVEEEPKVVELRGDDVNLVHHAYGANGIMTEIEMPLAPAWAWTEVIVQFPAFMTAVHFSHTLAVSDGIVKKLISILGWPIPQYIRLLRPFVRDGHATVLCMVAEQHVDDLRNLVKQFGGEITSTAAEEKGHYGVPIYEFTWGHTRLHVNKEEPSLVGNIALYFTIESIERTFNRFKDLGIHFEVKRFDGQLSFQGSPLYPFESDEQIAAIMQGMREDGGMVANNHTFLVKEGGMKTVDDADVVFKRAMDPYDLMNPGKMSFNDLRDAGASLPSEGWKYQQVKAS